MTITIDPWAQLGALNAELAATPVCHHVALGPVRHIHDCAYCALTDAAERLENHLARMAGRDLPNRRD